MTPFRFGINIRDATSRAVWQDKARKAEDLGYSTLLVPDHLAAMLATIPAVMSAAAATRHLRVGTNVLNNDLRHVDAAGIIHHVAGTSTSGYSGDGGPAALAQLHGPTRIEHDPNGDLYFCDTANHVIRCYEVALLEFVTDTGQAIRVERVESDDELDVAVLHLTESIDGFVAARARDRLDWLVDARPRANDSRLTGIITDARRPFSKGRGAEFPVLQLLVNEEATTKNLANAFSRAAAAAGPNDMFLFFYSGHGNQLDVPVSAAERSSGSLGSSSSPYENPTWRASIHTRLPSCVQSCGLSTSASPALAAGAKVCGPMLRPSSMPVETAGPPLKNT